MPEMTEKARVRSRKPSGKTSTRKYTKTSRVATSRRTSNRRGRPPGRTSPTRNAYPRTLSRRPRSSSGGFPGLLGSLRSLFRKPASNKPRNRQPEPASSGRTGMSLDRRLDLIGVILLFLGLLTILSLISASHNLITARWLTFLGQAFGWGAYLFPAALVIVGLWLVLRSFQHVPHVAIERLFGVTLFFINILGWMHFFSFPKDANALAASSGGGGYVGAFIFRILNVSLGTAGMAITLFAWLIIALVLVLDVSVVELFRWVPPAIERVQDGIQDWIDERRNHSGKAQGRLPTGKPGPPSNWPEMEMLTSKDENPIPVNGINLRLPRPWVLPAIDQILEKGNETIYDDDVDRQRARVIEETLRVLGAPVNVVEINRGPTITQFGVEPDFIETRGSRTRVRVAKIASLVDDLALALSARTIRVEAPVPGKGYVGIEVPNEQIALVTLRDVVESDAFRRLKSPLRFALGQDVAGNAVAADLSAMPHLLIAGQTGSGKSVCVNSLIACLLLHNTPDDLRLIMVDPKRVELTNYNGIPHLLAPVVVETEKVVGVLQWVL
ncbi:MAG TPA: DNA translocase FtsK 4TM domain-containing protein, partial [Anaerolineales bacterium]|nr:DNA translocase FtsK 4TM domain-containing protein [Anaerolineales bacterium]